MPETDGRHAPRAAKGGAGGHRGRKGPHDIA